MAGYVVAHITRVTDQAEYDDYRSKIEPTIQQYGGRFIVRGVPTVVEGEWPGRLVVIEFENLDAARRWYESDEYRPLLEQRNRSTEANLVMVEGYE